MTVHVRADCYITGVFTNTALGYQYNEMFANVVQFLSGPLCSAMGISLISSNFGRSGTGLGFWDQTTGSAGAGAWAIFRWSSSSYGSFDAMFMVSSGTNLVVNSVAPMNVAGQTLPFQGFNSHGLFGASFAALPSGSNKVPWNGTSGSFVSGTIGTPVWAADAAGKLCVFPRQNSSAIGGSSAGTFASQRNYMIDLDGAGLASVVDATPTRMHIVATPESFTLLQDFGVTNNYMLTHFGPWTARTTLFQQDVQYALITNGCNTPATNAPPAFYTTTYGSTAATTNKDGSIAHPSALSGSRTMAVTTINAQFPQNTFFNTFISGSGAYDVLPLYVLLADGTDLGIIGQFLLLQCVYGLNTHTVNFTSSSAVFGTNAAGSVKWVVPWIGAPPGSTNGGGQNAASSHGRDI